MHASMQAAFVYTVGSTVRYRLYAPFTIFDNVSHEHEHVFSVYKGSGLAPPSNFSGYAPVYMYILLNSILSQYGFK